MKLWTHDDADARAKTIARQADRELTMIQRRMSSWTHEDETMTRDDSKRVQRRMRENEITNQDYAQTIWRQMRENAKNH